MARVHAFLSVQQSPSKVDIADVPDSNWSDLASAAYLGPLTAVSRWILRIWTRLACGGQRSPLVKFGGV